MTAKDRLLFLMTRAHHTLQSHLKRRFQEEDIQISPAQMGILFLLKHGKTMTMSELSEALFIDNSTITGLVDRLEKRGFLCRRADEADRRRYSISITETGFEEITRAGALVNGVNAMVSQGFSDEEMEIFKRVLCSFFDKFK